MFRIIFNFSPERRDVNIDGAIRDVNILSPDRFQEIVTRNDLGGSLHKQDENLKFLLREFNESVAFQDLVLPQIDGNRATLNHFARFFGVGSAQHRAYSRNQLRQAEWLRNIVVGSEFESANLVGFLSSRSENDYRSRHAALSNLAANLESVLPW